MVKVYVRIVLFFAIVLSAAHQLRASCPFVTANFTFSETHTCGIPRVITLTNLSGGFDYAISSYYWYVNGKMIDSTIGLATVHTTFYSPGLYTIKLYAKSPNSACIDSIIKTDSVKTVMPGVYDQSSSLTYTPFFKSCILSTGIATTYNMQFNVDDTIKNFRIIWGDTAADSVGTMLFPDSTYSHNYYTLGHFNLKIVSVTALCTDTIVGLVINERVPSASLTPPNAGLNYGCLPFTVRFINGSYNSSESTVFMWDWGDGKIDTLGPQTYNDTIYHTYIKSANQGVGSCDKTVKLTAKNNCGTSVVTWQTVSIYDIDKAKITVIDTVMCFPKVGKTFIFNNASELNCRPGTRHYYWDFGDGTNSGWITLKSSQTHTYPTFGKYHMYLIDSSECGSDTFFLNTYVTNTPVAGITYDKKFGCKPLTVVFSDTVTTGLVLRTRKWDFADASNGQSQFDTNKTVSHTFYNAGTYLVRCTVTNPCDTASKWVIITVFEPPRPFITAFSNGCEPYTISNFNQSGGVSPYAHYFWDFGDGTFSTVANPPPKTYTAGLYTIRLKIVDTCGTDSNKVTFTVFNPIRLDYFTDSVCLNDSTHFNADSTKSVGTFLADSIISYTYKDSTTNTIIGSSANKRFTYKFATSGQKKITLTIQTLAGCVSSITKSIFVRERPTASFSYSPSPNVCANSQVSFTGNATAASSTITGYQWSFGDGGFAFSKDTVHTYTSPGNYAVTFTARNNFGCATTYIDTVRIRYKPIAKIKVSTACFGQVTSLIDSSYVPGGGTAVVNQWAWDYTGDGVFDAFTKNAVYTYNAAGNQTVILRVTTSQGCVGYDTARFAVDTLPNPSFTVDVTSKCMLQPFVFTNNSTRATLYTWKWGDGSSNTTVNTNASQQHAYTNSGTYTVKLFAFTPNGCTDSTSLVITVKPKSVAIFSVNDTAVCTPYTFHFTNHSLNSNTFQWYVNNVLTSTDTVLRDTLINTANAAIVVKLIAGNTNLCLSDTFSVTLHTFATPAADFTAYGLDSCNPFTIHFVNTSTGAVFYEWYFNDGTFMDNAKNPTHTFFNNSNKDSVYPVKLIAFNTNGCGSSKTMQVHVRPKPVANFIQSRTDSCGPLLVKFTNTSTPGDTESIYTMNFLWNFGNGITSTARDTSIRFTANANNDTTYFIKLKAFTKHGCFDTIFKTVVVHPNAKANFTTTRSDSCGPLRVTFTNTSTPGNGFGKNVMSFKWNFGNGIVSNVLDTSITFPPSLVRDTVYNVRLIAFSNFGCPDTIIKPVYVHAKPKARFTLPDTAGCALAPLTFVNTSVSNDSGTINNMTFFWNFGNGQTSTQINPVINYKGSLTQDTVYNITLVAYNSHGCPDTARSKYRVYTNPIDTFSAPNTGCSPLQINFANHTLNATKAYWDFGDGITDTVINPSHTFNGRYLFDTVYRVRMASRGTNGCLGDTVTKLITVKAKPQADFTATNLNGCTPLSTQFLNNSLGIISSNWIFGDGTTSSAINPSHTFNNITQFDTTYNVSLVVTSTLGCYDTLTKAITIHPRPTANFSINRADSCGPFTVTFTNTSVNGNGFPISAMTFKWDFGNGISSTYRDNIITFAPAVNADITYTVKLIAYSNFGCSDTITKQITVHPKSKADFMVSRSDSCGPFKVNFTNTSINGNGLPIDSMHFKWDFGNGVKSTARDTSVKFFASAIKDTIYNVKLISYSNFGCTDTIIKQIKVHPKPKSRFVMSDTALCSPGLVTFTNTSISNDSGLAGGLTYFWDFGNGKMSLNKNETVSFAGAFTNDTLYTIKLVTYSIYGCVDTSIQTLRVYPKPLDSFTYVPNNGCYNFPVNFINTTWNGDKYFWDFGDGTTDTLKNPVHVYSNNTYSSTFYHPKMVAMSVHGCPGDTVSRTLEVKPRPYADFATSPDSGCSPLRVQFLNMSIGATSYLWDFGDGTTSSQINPVHYFTLNTTYTITLVSFSQWGCPDTAIKTIKVKAFPNGGVTANVSAGCSPLHVQFTNTTTGASGYEWLYGDGFSDTIMNPSHNFVNNLNITAVYNVIMLAYNSFGCFDTTIYTIHVDPKPIANFVYSQPVLCGNSRFKFTDVSLNAYSYLWKFSDGTTDTAKNPLHTFVSSLTIDTTYNVKLIVTSPNGCKDSVAKIVVVPVQVHAFLSASPVSGCAPLTVNFTDQTKNAVSLIWYFGDGLATSIRNPVHTYVVPGKYSVKLIAMGADGCTDTANAINYIDVIEAPKADFNPTPLQQILPNSKVAFNNTSIYTTTCTFKWNFGDGSSSTLSSDSHTYADTGTYKVTLVIRNAWCSDSITKYVRILPYLPVAKCTALPQSGCVPLAVKFTNTSTNAYSYYWEFGDGNISTQTNPTHVYQNPGSYTIRLKAYGVSGESDTVLNNFILVYDRPVANFAGGPLMNYLPNGEVTFINLSVKASAYLWVITNTKDGNVITDTAQNPKIKLTREGVYTVKLTAYNVDGCPDSLVYLNYITVIADGSLYVPNAFSPNNDKINDVFKPEGNGIMASDYLFRIYDRWGELLFETNNPDVGWDGSYKGRKCEMDSYIWVLQGKFINDKVTVKKGSVLLVR